LSQLEFAARTSSMVLPSLMLQVQTSLTVVSAAEAATHIPIIVISANKRIVIVFTEFPLVVVFFVLFGSAPAL
jgi:hypothetical protein